MVDLTFGRAALAGEVIQATTRGANSVVEAGQLEDISTLLDGNVTVPPRRLAIGGGRWARTEQVGRLERSTAANAADAKAKTARSFMVNVMIVVVLVSNGGSGEAAVLEW